MLKNFRVYEAAIRIYHLCDEVKCAAHLKSQLLEAAASIGQNIAEGVSRMRRLRMIPN